MMTCLVAILPPLTHKSLVMAAFKRIKFLGEGSFGSVWKCFTPKNRAYRRSHPVVVVKRIKETDHSALNEVELLKCSSGHSGIVKYLDSFFDSKEHDLCIVMEYCNRGTLTQYAASMNKKEYSVWRILAQFASALQFLHSQHIIHRDLKPDNILCHEGKSDDGIQLKIADFGIAKLLNRYRLNQYYTDTCCGTEIYMAPEVVKAGGYEAHNRYGVRADIFSLGAVVSFYCNDEHLFTSARKVVSWQGGRSTLPKCYNYSLDLRQLVADMLSPSTNERPSAGRIFRKTNTKNRQK